jgi:CRP-like cAMP-binding protein
MSAPATEAVNNASTPGTFSGDVRRSWSRSSPCKSRNEAHQGGLLAGTLQSRRGKPSFELCRSLVRQRLFEEAFALGACRLGLGCIARTFREAMQTLLKGQRGSGTISTFGHGALSFSQVFQLTAAHALTFVGNTGHVDLFNCGEGHLEEPTLDRQFVLAALLRRLNKVSGLEESDVEAFRSLPIVVRRMEGGGMIVRDGDRPSECCLVVQGFCVRAKSTAAGQRQILSIHIPGEIPDLQSLHLHVMDHDLVALVPSTLGFINHTALRALTRARPNVAELLWRDTLIDSAIFREWIVNVGQRPAPNRFAHMVLELRERLAIVGKVEGASFEMPLTQEQLGEAMGITPVHANRIVRQLRDEDVLDFHRGRVTVLDERRLQKLADFDRRYLHQQPNL